MLPLRFVPLGSRNQPEPTALVSYSVGHGPHKPPAPGIAADLYENFAVFRRSTHEQRRLPASVIAGLGHIGPGDFNASYGIDAARAQHVNVADRDIWLVPGSAGFAMLLPAPNCDVMDDLLSSYGIVSGPLENVLAGRTVIWSAGRISPGESQTVIGLVPDTNKLIRMERGDGTVIEVPVLNNIYTATTATPFRVWQVRDASGDVHPVA